MTHVEYIILAIKNRLEQLEQMCGCSAGWFEKTVCYQMKNETKISESCYVFGVFPAKSNEMVISGGLFEYLD